MKLPTSLLILLLIWFQTLPAQEIGEPIPVDLAESSTTLTLDFSKCDYELILYSNDTHLEDSSFGLRSPLGYSVTAAFGASNPVLDGGLKVSPQTPVPVRVGLESLLRARERELASRLQETGGYRPGAAKIVPEESDRIRKFIFPSLQGLPRVTITALLVASGERANAYVDLLDVGRMIEALRSRGAYGSEDWLVLVSTDHGRRADGGHGGDSPEEMTTFVILSGDAARGLTPPPATHIVDLAVTALAHLDVEIDAGWSLDGVDLTHR